MGVLNEKRCKKFHIRTAFPGDFSCGANCPICCMCAHNNTKWHLCKINWAIFIYILQVHI